jgi:hypothetical protein
MRDWELVADKLSKAGWSWGFVSGVNSRRQTIFAVDAHRGALARSWYRVLVRSYK